MEIALKNGILHFNGLSEDEIKILYNKFRKDLLDANIIHYRPVAFMLEGSMANEVQDNISKISKLGYSFSELSFILNNIIISEKRGMMVKSLDDVASSSILKSDCSYMTLSGTTIGTEERNTMFYCGEGIQSKPRTLLKNMTILKKLKEPVSITLILKRGRGFLDFDDNQLLIYSSGFKPMRTYYNLYDFFRVRPYLGGTSMTLDYVSDIDEEVLKEILSDYFNSEEVTKCLE